MSITEQFMTLGRDYTGQKVAGWFMTEKLDGCRAFWDGSHLWTRQGYAIEAPKWFTNSLPGSVRLDGEIFAGRGKFQLARCATQYGHFSRRIRFVVFDCPDASGDYASRLSVATRAVRQCRYAATVSVSTIASHWEAFDRMNAVQREGGEGLILRNPETKRYETGRTSNLLKLKLIPGQFL